MGGAGSILSFFMLLFSHSQLGRADQFAFQLPDVSLQAVTAVTTIPVLAAAPADNQHRRASCLSLSCHSCPTIPVLAAAPADGQHGRASCPAARCLSPALTAVTTIPVLAAAPADDQHGRASCPTARCLPPAVASPCGGTAGSCCLWGGCRCVHPQLFQLLQ